jgi:hypothetical protein
MGKKRTSDSIVSDTDGNLAETEAYQSNEEELGPPSFSAVFGDKQDVNNDYNDREEGTELFPVTFYAQGD